MDEPVEENAETPPDGLIRVRSAIYGVALLWLAAMAGFGALQATVYGVTTEPVYVAVAAVTAAVSVGAGYGSMRAFGLR